MDGEERCPIVWHFPFPLVLAIDAPTSPIVQYYFWVRTYIGGIIIIIIVEGSFLGGLGRKLRREKKNIHCNYSGGRKKA